MQLSVNLKEKSYDIIIEHGVLNRIGNFADLKDVYKRQVSMVSCMAMDCSFFKWQSFKDFAVRMCTSCATVLLID